MEKLLTTLVLLTFSISTEKKEYSYQENKWNLIREDNFDGNTLDTTRWTLINTRPGARASDWNRHMIRDERVWSVKEGSLAGTTDDAGGSWVGEVNPDHLPVSMVIDWVKVYQQKSSQGH